jgi:hypothetical protein
MRITVVDLRAHKADMRAVAVRSLIIGTFPCYAG